MSNSTPKRSDMELVSKKFNIMDLADPRSPTTAFQRTPIQVILKNSTPNGTFSDNSTCAVISSPVSFVSLSSHLERDESLNLSDSSSSFVTIEDDLGIDSVNFSSQDWSAMVSDISMCSTDGYEKIDNKANYSNEQPALIRMENTDSLNSSEKSDSCLEDFSKYENSTVDNCTVESKQHFIKKPAKKLFYTPNKKRHPLGVVDNICPTTPPSHLSYGSPQNVLREKQWKRIQEERKKLGLEPDENLSLPLYDVTASAPSKLTLRKQRMHERLHLS